MTKFCRWCGAEFVPVIQKQIYCSADCRRLSTKENLAAKNLLKRRKRRVGTSRHCAAKCGTMLSIYNDSKLCESCKTKDSKKINSLLNHIREMTDGDSKGDQA